MNMTENQNNLEEVPQDSESHVSLPSLEKPRGFMQKIHNKIVGNGNFDPSKSVQTANNSYLMSTYGHSYSSAERLDNFLKALTTTISEKNSAGEFACVKVLPEDLLEYKTGIINLFKDKGYTVADLKDCIANVRQTYIFVCWDKFDPSKEDSH